MPGKITVQLFSGARRGLCNGTPDFVGLTRGLDDSSTMIVLLFLATATLAHGHMFDTIYAWNQLEFNFPNASVRDADIANGNYVPENNVPMGINVWRDKMFVTVARWRKGVASNLNYIWLNDSAPSPVLNPYPNWESNNISNPDAIVSIFRVKIDSCDRMWGVDTGIDDILGSSTVVQPMRLVVFDLKTDELIRSYTLKNTDLKQDSFIADFVVDVDPDDCDNAYAYLTDFATYGMIVYSWAMNDSWRINHNYFHFDPLNGNYNIGNIMFQWTDGIFGASLSPLQMDGHRTLYFHSMSGITEFSVSTEVLKDDTLALSNNYYAFHMVGTKGKETQGPTSVIDQVTGIDYFTQPSRNGVACWDTSTKLNPSTFKLVAQDNQTMVFPNDLVVDDPTDSVYVLSNNLQKLVFAKVNPAEKNFYVTVANIDALTAACKHNY